MDESLKSLHEQDTNLARVRASLVASPTPGDLREAIARAQRDAIELQNDPELLRAEREREEAVRKALEVAKARIWRDKVIKYAPVRAARLAFNLEATPAVRAVHEWLRRGCQHDLVLRGGIGVGKTSAAVAAVAHWVEPEVELVDGGIAREKITTAAPCVSWLRPHALISAIEHAYDPKAPKLYRYVVLEDLGRETRPEFVEAFCDLLDREEHTVLITTNLTKDAMRERYDARIIDRLCERARAIDLPGESRRRRTGDF